MLPSKIPDGAKNALSGIQLPLVYFPGFENFGEVSDEGVSSLRLNHHVIDVSLDVAADLLIEVHLDGPFIGHPGVLESEGHGSVAICTEGHDERCLDLVFFLEGDLVIAGVTDKEGEQFIAGGGVYNLVYLRQTKGVFRVVFVKISVINAHSPFFILFSNENRVC